MLFLIFAALTLFLVVCIADAINREDIKASTTFTFFCVLTAFGTGWCFPL